MITGSVGSADHLGRTATQGRELVRETHIVPDTVRAKLEGLVQTVLLPFLYLVPDERLLPPESIRCFFLDRAWRQAVLDGALSAGTPTTVEERALRERYDDIVKSIEGAGSDEGLDDPETILTGILIRSSLLTRWPGVEVRASATWVRKLRLSPSILLVLFRGTPRAFELVEPAGELSLTVSPAGDDFQLLRSTTGAVPRVIRQRAGSAPGVLEWTPIAAERPAPPSASVAFGLLHTRSACLFSGIGDLSAADVYNTTAGGPE